MTSSLRSIAPVYKRDLDPLLLLPVRLFIVCLLADMRWCDEVAVQGVLRQSERKFAPHVERLRIARVPGGPNRRTSRKAATSERSNSIG